MISTISIVVPVYNSEATLGALVDKLVSCISPHFERLEIVLVNDGSKDNSHNSVLDAVERHPGIVRYLKLARNFGEHNAVMCGLRHTTCDYVAIIDDDFQNPPEEILKLVETMRQGYDVVFSKYEKKHHSLFRNLGSAFNDFVASKVLKKPKGLYLSSFKVMNRFLVEVVTDYTGPYPYIDGLILRSTDAIGTCTCAHQPRETGRSNYTLTRLIRLWLNMFTSFSVVPLRFSSMVGGILSVLGILLAILFALERIFKGLFFDEALPAGWASLIVCMTLFFGFQFCMLGMIGEYLGRLFLTQNREPQFVVREKHGFDDGEEPDNG